MSAMTCHRCGETKPRDAFRADDRNTTGRRGVCRACDAEGVRERRRRRREQRDQSPTRPRRTCWCCLTELPAGHESDLCHRCGGGSALYSAEAEALAEAAETRRLWPGPAYTQES